MNKQADTTYKAEPGAVINTMLNPLAGRPGLGQRYVPKWFQPSGGTTSGEPTAGDKLLFSVLALAGTYGTATAVGRLISSRLEKGTYEDKFKKQMSSYLNAQMPVISPDPLVGGDFNKEEELEQLGVAKTPEEGLNAAFIPKKAADKFFDEKWSMVVPALAIAGSAYAAYRMVDHLNSKQRVDDLADETKKEKDRLDRLNYLYMMQARNPQGELVQKMSSEISKEGSLASSIYGTSPTTTSDQTWSGGAKALALLVAATSFGVGAIASKNYFDSKDVNRERLKIMRDTMRGVASSENPPVVMPIMDTRTMRGMNRHITGDPVAAPRKLSVSPEPRQLSEAQYDPNDIMMQKAVNV